MTGSARGLWHGHLGRESARAKCPCQFRRDARTTPHAATPSAAGPLFSMTFSLCSGDFGVWAAFSSTGLSVPASSPTTLLSSSAARSSGSAVGAVREPAVRNQTRLAQTRRPVSAIRGRMVKRGLPFGKRRPQTAGVCASRPKALGQKVRQRKTPPKHQNRRNKARMS